MLPVMRALDARIQDAIAPLQQSELPRLLTKDFGSDGVSFERGELFLEADAQGDGTPRGEPQRRRRIFSDGSA